MTHAATLQTAPDLQALFDSDWTSGKYRRPKCSKADYYAGWLTAYERFAIVAPIEKVTVVKAAAAAAVRVEPEHVTGWTPALSQYWLEGVKFTEPKAYNGHREILATWSESVLRLKEYNSGEWTIERKNPHAKHEYLSWDALEGYQALPLKVARIVAARELKGLSVPEKTVTRYSGGLPLKREKPQWSGKINEHGSAIPDGLIRKLAIMAGRPAIAP